MHEYGAKVAESEYKEFLEMLKSVKKNDSAQQEFLTTLTADHRQRVIRRWNSIRKKIADIGEPSTLDELAHTVIGLVNKKLPTGTSVTGFSWDIRYTQHVPNTHSSPVFGVENWRQDNDIPCNYTGFVGRVWIRFNNYLSHVSIKIS